MTYPDDENKKEKEPQETTKAVKELISNINKDKMIKSGKDSEDGSGNISESELNEKEIPEDAAYQVLPK